MYMYIERDLLKIKIEQDDSLQQKTDLTKEEIFNLSKLCTEDPYFECEFGFFKQTAHRWEDH